MKSTRNVFMDIINGLPLIPSAKKKVRSNFVLTKKKKKTAAIFYFNRD